MLETQRVSTIIIFSFHCLLKNYEYVPSKHPIPISPKERFDAGPHALGHCMVLAD